MNNEEAISQIVQALEGVVISEETLAANNILSELSAEQKCFAAWGKCSSIPISPLRVLEHGTSPGLISQASYLIQKDFQINSERDYIKYFCRNKYSYYAIIRLLDHSKADCAIRVILDDLHKPKIIILDYIRTRSKAKGLGLGTKLVKFVLSGAASLGSNVYVTSTIEAISYWVRFGFIQETDPETDEKLNEFSDCTLLSLPSNSKICWPTLTQSQEATELLIEELLDDSTEEPETDDSTSEASESDAIWILE